MTATDPTPGIAGHRANGEVAGQPVDEHRLAEPRVDNRPDEHRVAESRVDGRPVDEVRVAEHRGDQQPLDEHRVDGQPVNGYRVLGREEQFRGPVFTIVTDQVTMPGGRVAARDYMVHVGAVGVVALDDEDRVVLVRQYRHPLGRHLWELPAGLIDVAGESLPDAAARELAEEADLRAGRLDVLIDLHTSPGCSNERIRVYLARQLSPVPEAERHERRDEEAEMVVVRLDLDEAVRRVLAGEITNAACVAGLLAAARVRDQGWAPLRPVDAPLP